MNARHAISFDKYFNVPYKVIAFISGMAGVSNRTPEKKLVIKFFGIGSIIRTLNYLENSKFNKDEIVFLTLKSNSPFIRSQGYATLELNDASWFFMIFSGIRNMIDIAGSPHYEIYDLERSSNLVGIFRELSGIRKRKHFGVYEKTKSNSQFGRRIDLRDKNAWNALEEIFGEKAIFNQVYHRNESELIVVNINASDYLPERKMSNDKWREILSMLKDDLETCQLVLTGMKHEWEDVEELRAMLSKEGVQCENTAGKLSFTEWQELIKSASMVLSVDSSAAHLAAFHSVPLVVFWGPTTAETVGYIQHPNVLNVSRRLTCQPCFVHPKSRPALACNSTLECLKELNVKEVCSEIINFYERTKYQTVESPA